MKSYIDFDTPKTVLIEKDFHVLNANLIHIVHVLGCNDDFPLLPACMILDEFLKTNPYYQKFSENDSLEWIKDNDINIKEYKGKVSLEIL